jgi:diguanylate cyclase (GGDEF)-like protein
MYGEHSLWRKLVKPDAAIAEASARRQARMISSALLAMPLSMIIAVIYLIFFSTTPRGAVVFILANIGLGGLYFLSRTRHNRLAGILSVIWMCPIPVVYIAVTRVFNLESILISIIANTLTLLISSAIISVKMTTVVAVFNVLNLLFVFIIVPSAPAINIILTLLSNAVIATAGLVFARHRNLMEKDRTLELARLNDNLQDELRRRKETEDRLSYVSVHDPLTDLPNRVLFIDRLSHAMERAKRHFDFKFAVFFLDLDRFKVVNDSLGHNVGDKLLVESSKRLSASIRGEDTVARLGGDEFVILLEDIKDKTEVIQIAERIQNRLAMPYDLDGHVVFVFCSMGIVLNGADYENPDDLLRDADIAMYRAKGQGLGHYKIFDPSMLDRVMTRLELETDLRKALDHQQFVVQYQPIIDMHSQRIIGFEALVRWQHPARGLIPPAEFIPTAEETGLIIPLGYWVLDEACRQVHAWNVEYNFDPPLTINVNLSVRQCEQPDLVEKISDILRKNKVDPTQLKLELTESLIIEDSDEITAMLEKLRDLNIQVQIDDFGTGYSSLSYLHTLPIDTLKIDRSFISRLGGQADSGEIVQTILALAHKLGMKVIAEGVETEEQYTELTAMDCEFMQGFLFSEAVDELEVRALLKKFVGKVERGK